MTPAASFAALVIATTACARIPGAKLFGIEGMGHDFPPDAVSQLVNRLMPFLQAHTPL